MGRNADKWTCKRWSQIAPLTKCPWIGPNRLVGKNHLSNKIKASSIIPRDKHQRQTSNIFRADIRHMTGCLDLTFSVSAFEYQTTHSWGINKLLLHFPAYIYLLGFYIQWRCGEVHISCSGTLLDGISIFGKSERHISTVVLSSWKSKTTALRPNCDSI